jgi:glutaryl-CoA dehydrogenase
MAGIFSKLKQAYKLYQQIDMDKLAKLSAKVDLKEVMDKFAGLDEDDEQQWRYQKSITRN